MTPQLSIVIPTYNRRHVLSQVLDGLAAQTAPAESFEVIVVDDGSSDGTAEWLARQVQPFSLRVLRQQNKGPSAARNAGIEVAKGELLLFLDDDVVPTSETVREHLLTHAAENNVAVIGPLSSLAKYRQPWVVWHQKTLEKTYALWTRTDQLSFRSFWTGSTSVAKSSVVSAGCFDTTLARCEDVDLGYRLMEHGVRFRFNEAAGGFHHAERTLASWRNIQADYGRFEVQMTDRIGEAEMRQWLATNWEHRHPLNRWLARCCAGRRYTTALCSFALTGVVQVARLRPQSKVSLFACAALSNLLFWHAILIELGKDSSFLTALGDASQPST